MDNREFKETYFVNFAAESDYSGDKKAPFRYAMGYEIVKDKKYYLNIPPKIKNGRNPILKFLDCKQKVRLIRISFPVTQEDNVKECFKYNFANVKEGPKGNLFRMWEPSPQL